MQYRIDKSFTFEAAHRLVDYVGKCARIHGHSYQVRLHLASVDLRSGMVTDFGDLGGFEDWVKDTFDHKLILCARDPLVTTPWGTLPVDICEILRESVAVVAFNPTCENLSEYLLDCARRVFLGTMVIGVTVRETKKEIIGEGSTWILSAKEVLG